MRPGYKSAEMGYLPIPKKGSMRGFLCKAATIRNLMGSIIMTFAYLVGIGLALVIAKISGKKLLEMNISRQRKSYWEDIRPKKKTIKDH